MAWTARWLTVGGAVLALAASGGCGGGDEETEGGPVATEPAQSQTQPPPAETDAEATGGAGDEEGRQTFAATCGGCHTLADAKTNGKVGPSLDAVRPDKEQVLTALKSGPGVMPANLLEGARADTVAEYVANVAGK